MLSNATGGASKDDEAPGFGKQKSESGAWKPPKDPLELETGGISPLPSDELKETLDFVDKQITLISARLAGDIPTEIDFKGELIITGRERRAQLEAEKMAWHLHRAQLEVSMKSDRPKQLFYTDFQSWLLGKGREKDHLRTPWYRTPIREDSVHKYLEGFIEKRMDYLKKLDLLKFRGPSNVYEAYLYYKYIVRGEEYKQDHISFLSDWDKFSPLMLASDNAYDIPGPLGEEYAELGGPKNFTSKDFKEFVRHASNIGQKRRTYDNSNVESDLVKQAHKDYPYKDTHYKPLFGKPENVLLDPSYNVSHIKRKYDPISGQRLDKEMRLERDEALAEQPLTEKERYRMERAAERERDREEKRKIRELKENFRQEEKDRRNEEKALKEERKRAERLEKLGEQVEDTYEKERLKELEEKLKEGREKMEALTYKQAEALEKKQAKEEAKENVEMADIPEPAENMAVDKPEKEPSAPAQKMTTEEDDLKAYEKAERAADKLVKAIVTETDEQEAYDKLDDKIQKAVRAMEEDAVEEEDDLDREIREQTEKEEEKEKEKEKGDESPTASEEKGKEKVTEEEDRDKAMEEEMKRINEEVEKAEKLLLEAEVKRKEEEEEKERLRVEALEKELRDIQAQEEAKEKERSEAEARMKEEIRALEEKVKEADRARREAEALKQANDQRVLEEAQDRAKQAEAALIENLKQAKEEIKAEAEELQATLLSVLPQASSEPSTQTGTKRTREEAELPEGQAHEELEIIVKEEPQEEEEIEKEKEKEEEKEKEKESRKKPGKRTRRRKNKTVKVDKGAGSGITPKPERLRRSRREEKAISKNAKGKNKQT